MTENNNLIKTKTQSLLSKLIIITFLSIPFLSSIISTFHLVSFFELGNYNSMAIVLAIAFEVGSIASLLTITVLDKIKSWMIYTIFFILVSLQICGNVYFSFDYINQSLLKNPNWLDSSRELFSYILGNDLQTIKIFLSLLIGIPIPLISLLFLKSTVDYLKPEKLDLLDKQSNEFSESKQISLQSDKESILKNEIDYVANSTISERGTSNSTDKDLYRTREGNLDTNNSSDTSTNQESTEIENENKISDISLLPGFNPPIMTNSNNE